LPATATPARYRIAHGRQRLRHAATNLAQAKHPDARLGSASRHHRLPLPLCLLTTVLPHMTLHMQHPVQHILQHLLRHTGIRQPDNGTVGIQIITFQDTVHPGPQHKYGLQIIHIAKETGWRVPHHGMLHPAGVNLSGQQASALPGNACCKASRYAAISCGV
jgi:hypothetical protein